MTFIKSFISALLLTAASPAAASRVSIQTAVCPVCLADFDYRAEMSASVFDTGLDFRPLGMIASPPHLRACGECGFIAPAETAGPRELAAWREIALSPEYKALAERNAYYRKALIYTRLGGKNSAELANFYLKAAWADAGDKEREKEGLQLALENLSAALEETEYGGRDWAYTQYLRAELLRRLSRFGEARRALAQLRSRRVARDPVLHKLIKYQRVLCLRRVPDPRGLGEMERETFLDKVMDRFRWPL